MGILSFIPKKAVNANQITISFDINTQLLGI
jgi:hypothetical protein